MRNRLKLEVDKFLDMFRFNDVANLLYSHVWGKFCDWYIELSKIKLSKDANEILKILLLTNTHYPQKNITENEFLDLKSDWLIKNKDVHLHCMSISTAFQC